MTRLDRIPRNERNHLLTLPCPTYERTPWVTGPPLAKRRPSGLFLESNLRRPDHQCDPGGLHHL